jgi:capsular exopolysaccharide synthesis family protein
MSVIATRDKVPQIAPPGGLIPFRPTMPTAPVGGLTPADILRILRKRMWIIILSTLIVSALAAAATFIWLRMWPFFTARALLEVEAPKTTELNIQTQLYPKEIMDRIKMSHAKLVATEGVLREAAKIDVLKQTNWFSRQDDVVKRLSEELTVSPIPETNFIQLSMTATDKNDLPEVVNAVAQAYVKYSQDILLTSHNRDATRFRGERDRFESELVGIRGQAATAKRDFPDMRSNVSAVGLQLQEKSRELNDKERLLSQAQQDMAVVDAQEKAGALASSPYVQESLQMDATLRNLEYAKTNLLTRRETMMEKFGPEHRSVQEFKITLESIEKEIANKTKVVTEMAARSMRLGAETKLRNIQGQLDTAKQKYEEVINTQKDLQASLTTLEGLVAKEESLTQNINKIDARLLEIGLLAGGGQRGVWIAAPAELPKEPSMPKWGVMLPIGVVVGLMIGLSISFLLELMDTSIKNPTDISRKVDLPMLGMIPHGEDMQEEIENFHLVFRTHPNSLVGEAFRHIHTCLLFSGPASQRRTLLIASASPQDGRTSVAVNLAATAARAGRRVVLVDTNFRQPKIKELFACEHEQGLSSILVGQAEWRDLAIEVEPNLSVLPAGVLPPNPAELLGSEQMRQLIAEMTSEFDQVIFDSAPCMIVSDAVALSTMVDGVVLVVRAGTSTHGLVQRARDTFNRVGAKVLGVVLNGMRATPGGYLRKNYETFYEYHEQTRQLPTA